MTPTPAQMTEWREDFAKAFPARPLSASHLALTDNDYVFVGYIRARTEQADEIVELKAKLAELQPLRNDAERYQKHCRNAQVAAWCGLDPNAPDVLKRLDVYIDAAIAKDTQLSALGEMVKISQEMGLYEPPIAGEAT